MPEVAIFGIGPAGMVTAHAALSAGHSVTFFSSTNKMSTLHGCQYLHAPVPGIRVPRTIVEYRLYGTPEQYRRKVYGDDYAGSVSPQALGGEHEAWDIRATYSALWDTITQHPKVNIVPAQIDYNWPLIFKLDKFDHVISTIPATALCANPSYLRQNERHFFDSRQIWATGYQEKYPSLDRVICDGREFFDWYRSAEVFGHRTIEWPRNRPPTLRLRGGAPKPVKVRKPVDTNCDCHPEITRLGRYGKWQKGVLVHHVYEEAVKLFSWE